MNDIHDDPRYEIKNEEIQALLFGVLSYLKEHVPDGWGATLFLFQYEDEAMFYGSTAQRAGILRALREFLNREQ